MISTIKVSPKGDETPEAFESRRESEKVKWRARKALDPANYHTTSGSWQYSKENNERRWATRHAQSPSFELIQKTKELALGESVGPTFPTHEGDKEISYIYRQFWVGGDKKAFLEELDKYACQTLTSDDADNAARIYANESCTIPEKTLWKIFRCLVSELVPIEQAWDGIPPYMIDEPNTIWQIGKCMLTILTRGRFWDEEYNALNPVDHGEKFGVFKKKVLQAKYSRNLMKYILGCLSGKEQDRWYRQVLLDHFETVLSVYEGKYTPEPEDETDDQPYKPKKRNPLIPDGLTNAEGKVYEKLIKIVKKRLKANVGKPYIVTITDLAKDYDDLTAMLCLKELKRLSVVDLEGFVANLMPADKRGLFGRGALDSLHLPKTPMGVGTDGTTKPHEVLDYEFAGTDTFMSPRSCLPSLPEGQTLLKRLFTKAADEGRKLTFLGISSFKDIAQFAREEPELLQIGLSNVVLQGGYRVVNGHLIADPAAANNKFDMKAARYFHEFLDQKQIPSAVWTKVATFATSIPTTVFEFMEDTKHPLGPYLRQVQIGQDSNFYLKSCSEAPFAPHMTAAWYLKNRTAWFSSGHEPDEPYPDVKELKQYFVNVTAYDALAAVGASGEDVVEEFGFIKPFTSRPDADHEIYKVIGVAAVPEEKDQNGKVVIQKALPQDCNFNPEPMNIVVTALLKGALLSVQQGMPS